MADLIHLEQTEELGSTGVELLTRAWDRLVVFQSKHILLYTDLGRFSDDKVRAAYIQHAKETEVTKTVVGFWRALEKSRG